MNRFHRRYCAGAKWDALMRERLLPDALDGVELGDNVLELGPGPGLTTQALAPMTTHLTAIEIDPNWRASRPLELDQAEMSMWCWVTRPSYPSATQNSVPSSA